ncbi:MAG: aminotransferase class I/II-fold pyridoxal phosphate-dependent enzyme [Pseudomonadota bacterium]
MDYPKAKIPTEPVVDLSSFGLSNRRHVPSVLDVRHVLHTTSGRMAIGLALQQMRIAANDEILMPAYHSRSMVEPVIAMDALPVFYRIRPDTSVDLNDIASKINPRTKVLVAVNYFGFPQDLAAIRQFCDRHQLLLLEDCAHAFMGEHAGKALGSFGDYAIASTMKFFPVVDGGCLVSSTHRLDGIVQVSAGLRFEIKTAFNTLEKAFAYQRMLVLDYLLSLPMALKNRLWRLLKSRTAVQPTAIGPRASDGAFGFEAQWLDKRASFASTLILKFASKARAADRRRARYLQLQAALHDLPNCAPLYASLPEGIFPWVFPLKVTDPAGVFPKLKHAGIPVVRFAEFLWDEVDASVCAVSTELSRSVMQLPCHQALRDDEFDWMISSVRKILLTHTVAS